jgi:2-oxoacid:acceptor oxidoreductase gamma subunit (pyruvate/2-ketoisovalerate family)/2-oxoacid:acceptor oxidoreductase delta subunit (pyruvate/2-ketoisovalerate family)
VYQIRIHGRGGQGVVTASELLAVAAFCRIDDHPIRTREPVSAPDCVIVQDPTLLGHVDVLGGLAPTGRVLVNAPAPVSLPVEAVFVWATGLALQHLGRPVPNAALLGGFAALTGVVRLESVPAAIRDRFPARADGDIVKAERTVTNAIGQGRRAATAIDGYLRASTPSVPGPSRPATFERLNTWYYSDAPATVAPQLAAARRVSTFDEVVGSLDVTTALFEARRCLSCANCFECDNCFGVCPDNAIRKLGPGGGYEIDYDYCKGCGLCVAECPAGAIDLVPEQGGETR